MIHGGTRRGGSSGVGEPRGVQWRGDRGVPGRGDGVGFGTPTSLGQEEPQRARGDSQGGVAGGLPPHKGSRLRLTVQSCNGPVVSVQLTMARISSTREL